MKDQLTIQELSAYLPWEVTALNFDFSEVVEITLFDAHDALIAINDDNFRLLLYPLSSITKEIEHKGEKFVPIEKILEYFGYEIVMYNGNLAEPISMMPYVVVQKLFEWHFAVNISENLYIDKTTIL